MPVPHAHQPPLTDAPPPPRYVLIGAGAIGVSLAAELERSGHHAVLVARGAQLAAARSRGITYARPDGTRTLGVPVHGGPDELELREGDVLVLATKTQDAAAALETWARQPVVLADGTRTTAGERLALVTTQNGLETERIALRHFATVIGGVLATPAGYVEPGVVVAAGSPFVGIAWLGAYPDRALPLAEDLARTLRDANYAATAVRDISAWKLGKLVASSTFVLDALFPPGALRDAAAELLRQETLGVLRGVGEVSDLGAALERTGAAATPVAVPGHAYGGTSTWQSLARSSSLETDYLNGEVVLQARLQGIDAPANAALGAALRDAVDRGLEPRSLGDDELRRIFPALSGTSAGRDPAATAPRDAVLVGAGALARELEGPDPPALLDVRWALGDPYGREHHAEAHLPTAVYVDLDTELAAPASPELGRHPLPSIATLQASARAWGLRQGRPVVVYDDTAGTSAARAWWLLRWAGVADVRILDGGLGAWKAAGGELEHGPGGPSEPGDVVLSAGHLPTLDIDEVPGVAAGGVLLDARAGERYRGETEPIDPRAGHIPGAVSAPTAENVDADGRFRPDAELAAHYAAVGARDGIPVGVYCGSGVTAAHDVAALATLGITASLFPGSWSAWSSDPARPAAIGAHATTQTEAVHAG
ncbi:rhodanese-like domain-containing protein [Patulibacter sp. NPDC049589]|uniref:rhodanese-like domain-containing protein n=1 Tax=Patulibacter sp. NPDC049589 TaxID=3154731 RepID=UPI00341D11D3